MRGAATQILTNFPAGLLAVRVLNGAFTVLAYFLFWKRWKAKLHPSRIQTKERVDRSQIQRELWNSLTTRMVGALFSRITTPTRRRSARAERGSWPFL